MRVCFLYLRVQNERHKFRTPKYSPYNFKLFRRLGQYKILIIYLLNREGLVIEHNAFVFAIAFIDNLYAAIR